MYILYYELIRHRYFIALSKAINTDLIFSTVKRVRAGTWYLGVGSRDESGYCR